MNEKVILVDKNGNEIGTEEKLKAHKLGKLHRAFSVFIFNSKREILLQKRASHKYHSGGLWTNTCCSHPRPGEKIPNAAYRRLKEEMGIECDLKEVYTFTYKILFENGLTEHEYDHVFIGKSDANPKPDSSEVEDWKWINNDLLREDIKEYPENYTYWFKQILHEVLKNRE